MIDKHADELALVIYRIAEVFFENKHVILFNHRDSIQKVYQESIFGVNSRT